MLQVFPGDIVVGDDSGVVVPQDMAETVAEIPVETQLVVLVVKDLRLLGRIL